MVDDGANNKLSSDLLLRTVVYGTVANNYYVITMRIVWAALPDTTVQQYYCTAYHYY
jgi:hypothetical protein